jgi:5'-methylthioadenosine phosphorylase
MNNSTHPFLPQAIVGVIGGSGLYQMDALEQVQEIEVSTPFGKPSEKIVLGRVQDTSVAFLARHGRGHRLLPSEVPYRANICALKQLGVKYVLSFSAVGSLCEEFHPLDLVLPDQFIDMTRLREGTFFGAGAVAHVSMAQPVCAATSSALASAAQQVLNAEESTAKPRIYAKGSYVCIEGPQFSSFAESNWYRSIGAGVIGMTNMPEAKLAREAQMAYATLAMVTDFDCWHPKEEAVSATMALDNLLQNASRAQKIAALAIQILGTERPESIAHTALKNALVTQPEQMSSATQERLASILL